MTMQMKPAYATPSLNLLTSFSSVPLAEKKLIRNFSIAFTVTLLGKMASGKDLVSSLPQAMAAASAASISYYILVDKPRQDTLANEYLVEMRAVRFDTNAIHALYAKYEPLLGDIHNAVAFRLDVRNPR